VVCRVNDPVERIAHVTHARNAGYLALLSRMRDVLVDGVRARIANPPADTSDPRPAAIVGAAFACLIAAQTTWLASDQTRSFAEVLDRR